MKIDTNPSKVKFSSSHVLSYDNIFPSNHFHLISAITINHEPTTYKQAVKHPHWIQAMNSELDALSQNLQWIVTDIPLGKRPIGCKWIYKIKYKADGTI